MELVGSSQALWYSRWRESNHLHEEHLCFSYTVMTHEMCRISLLAYFVLSCFALLILVNVLQIEGYYCLWVFFFSFLLEYCWFTILCYFLLYSTVNQLYICINLHVLRFFSHICQYIQYTAQRIKQGSLCYSRSPY